MIRCMILFSFLAIASGFMPMQQVPRSEMALSMDRRQMIATGIATVIAGPSMAQAKPASTWFFDENIENVKEEAQMKTSGKLDINAAFVGDYKELRGMFPTAAGKIASNGPYEKVQDIYKIEGLTSHDRALFKKYENRLTVNPPGRAFNERINARVST